MQTTFHELSKRWKFILFLGLFVGLLAGGVTFFWPLKYRADAQVLIITKTRAGVDPYTVVKSSERVGENLVQVMKTDDFMKRVRSLEGYQLDWSVLDVLNERQRRREWPKMVVGSVVYGTGMVTINVYHRDPEMAKRFAGAIGQTLSDQAWEYVGGDVVLKVVNSPIATRWPVQPNIPLHVLLGTIAGALLAIFTLSRSH
jgi:capsular polysaccharide biosynthesis protein